ncbi:tc5 transposase DNA-binding domain-containing protein [Phthorimaea operculella]|nr:tc5 transposase DNA-binding domain-containing protein [Phthorimaea operculella]
MDSEEEPDEVLPSSSSSHVMTNERPVQTNPIKRKAPSLDYREIKLKILRAYDELSNTKKPSEIAEFLRLSPATLATILENRKKIEENKRSENSRSENLRKKRLKVGYVELDELLMQWYHRARASNQPINSEVIHNAACKIADSHQIPNFAISIGWIHSFKKRHGIVYTTNVNPTESVQTIKHYETEMADEPQLPKATPAQKCTWRAGKYRDVDKLLVEWCHQASASNLPINAQIIHDAACKIAKSRQIGNIDFPIAWIESFRKRHEIVYTENDHKESVHNFVKCEKPIYRGICRRLPKNVKIEKMKTVAQKNTRMTILYPGLPNLKKSVTERTNTQEDSWMTSLSAMLKNYEPRDIFSADKFKLSFNSMSDESDVSFEQNNVTVLACVNADGSKKIPLLVIGKEKYHPRYIVQSLVIYEYDKYENICGITGPRLLKWFKSFDERFQVGFRKILFVADWPINHAEVKPMRNTIVNLPSKKPQPMDEGIIKALKEGYRTQLENHQKDGKITVLDAVQYIGAAWKLLKPETIQTCFKKAGFLKGDVDKNVDDVVVPGCSRSFLVNKNDAPCEDNDAPLDGNVAPSDDNVAPFQDNIVPDNTAPSGDNVGHCYVRSYDDILLDVLNIKDETLTDDDEEKASPVLTKALALSAVSVLKRYLASCSESEEVLQMMNSIESFVITKSEPECHSST